MLLEILGVFFKGFNVLFILEKRWLIFLYLMFGFSGINIFLGGKIKNKIMFDCKFNFVFFVCVCVLFIGCGIRMFIFSFKIKEICKRCVCVYEFEDKNVLGLYVWKFFD